jgi:hypothetical protein
MSHQLCQPFAELMRLQPTELRRRQPVGFRDKARDTLAPVDRLIETKGCPYALRTVETALKTLIVAAEATL